MFKLILNFFNLIIGLVFIAFSLVGTISHANEDEKPSYVLCQIRSTVRTIRMDKTKHGCSTIYTKEGVDQIVSSSIVEKNCLEVVNNIRSNLEKGEWKCRDISQARISSSLGE